MSIEKNQVSLFSKSYFSFFTKTFLAKPNAGFKVASCAGFSISSVAQRKRAGPITQRSVDRNHALLPNVVVDDDANPYFTLELSLHNQTKRLFIF